MEEEVAIVVVRAAELVWGPSQGIAGQPLIAISDIFRKPGYFLGMNHVIARFGAPNFNNGRILVIDFRQ